MTDVKSIKELMVHTKWYVGFPMPDDWMQKHIDAVKEHYNNCIDCKDWLGAIFIVERPYRAQELCNLLPYMSAEEKWEAVKEVWLDSENPYINKEFWTLCFTLPELKPYFEHSKKGLPESKFTVCKGKNIITIYRGMSVEEYKSKQYGISWTLCKEKAQWFANRFTNWGHPKGKVKTLKVNVEDIVCWIPDRNEMEVIYF